MVSLHQQVKQKHDPKKIKDHTKISQGIKIPCQENIKNKTGVMDMSVIVVNNNNFSQEVLQSDKPVLVDFFATWCGPCKMLSPIVDQLADEHPEVKVCKLDVDENQDLAQQFQVMSIPTLILFKDGQAASKVVGLQTKAALEQLIK